jgi:hypothetical protein
MIEDVVDRHKVGVGAFIEDPENRTADPAKSVNGNSHD